MQNKEKLLDALLLVHQAWPVWRSTLGTVNFGIKSAEGGAHSPSGLTLRDNNAARILLNDYPAHESELMSGTMPHAARGTQRLRLPRKRMRLLCNFANVNDSHTVDEGHV